MEKNIRLEWVVGLDVGDRKSRYAVVNREGELVEEGGVETTREALSGHFAGRERMMVVIETGTHSPWISRLLEELGHQVLVGNARKIAAIYLNRRKRDRIDAITLARLGRMDPELLHPIQHRGQQAQADLALIRSRHALVRARGRLIGHARGLVKSVGGRLKGCDTDNFHQTVPDQIPAELRAALDPIVKAIGHMSGEIRRLDHRIESLGQRYPETEQLRQVDRVGPITSVAYVLTLENPERFAQSRSVGPYLGLIPRLDQSGETSRQGRITKEGDPLVRSLLVQCAQQILGPFGKDCDLRRFGLRLWEQGGRHGKKRAVVAVARKLAVLLHHLWLTGETYDPFYNSKNEAVSA
jgi:transposase